MGHTMVGQLDRILASIPRNYLTPVAFAEWGDVTAGQDLAGEILAEEARLDEFNRRCDDSPWLWDEVVRSRCSRLRSPAQSPVPSYRPHYNRRPSGSLEGHCR
jgi:hypothetical protein